MSNRLAIGASIVGAAIIQYMYVRHENSEAHHSIASDVLDGAVDISKLTPAKRLETFGQCIGKKTLRGSGTWRSQLQSDSPNCGEDSFYFSDADRTFGVADGVGGWSRHGVNPKEFSQSLMTELGKQVESLRDDKGSQGGALDIVTALDKSHAASRRAVAAGSSTAIVATLDSSTGTLKTVNVGDSGLIVFRGPSATPVFVAEETSHGFNFPMQLGVNRGKRHGDSVHDGSKQEVRVFAGDIAVTASDGVLDNLHVKDIADIIRASKGDTRKAAKDLVIAAGESALGIRSSNHVKGQWGEGDGVGGKPDDITVLVTKFNA